MIKNTLNHNCNVNHNPYPDHKISLIVNVIPRYICISFISFLQYLGIYFFFFTFLYVFLYLGIYASVLYRFYISDFACVYLSELNDAVSLSSPAYRIGNRDTNVTFTFINPRK